LGATVRRHPQRAGRQW